MFRRYPHPLLKRQAVDLKKQNGEEQPSPAEPAEVIRAEAAGEEFQAAGAPSQPSLRLARAYVPWQRYGRVFSPAEALEKGTLFPELYSPYPH